MAEIDISDLMRLSVAERIRLAEDLWDSVAREAEADPDLLPLTAEERDELDRRLADYEAHPETSVPWEEVKARLLERG